MVGRQLGHRAGAHGGIGGERAHQPRGRIVGGLAVPQPRDGARAGGVVPGAEGRPAGRHGRAVVAEEGVVGGQHRLARVRDAIVPDVHDELVAPGLGHPGLPDAVLVGARTARIERGGRVADGAARGQVVVVVVDHVEDHVLDPRGVELDPAALGPARAGTLRRVLELVGDGRLGGAPHVAFGVVVGREAHVGVVQRDGRAVGADARGVAVVAHALEIDLVVGRVRRRGEAEGGALHVHAVVAVAGDLLHVVRDAVGRRGVRRRDRVGAGRVVGQPEVAAGADIGGLVARRRRGGGQVGADGRDGRRREPVARLLELPDEHGGVLQRCELDRPVVGRQLGLIEAVVELVEQGLVGGQLAGGDGGFDLGQERQPGVFGRGGGGRCQQGGAGQEQATGDER